VGYIDNAAMKTIMIEIAKGDGLLICSTHDNKLCKDGIINAGEIAKHKDLAGIPKSAELISVMRNLFLAEETGCRIHISGISLGKSVEMIRNAKDNGVNVTCSVAPPYFSVNEREIFFREAMAKLMPPLRNPKDVAAIVQGLADNTIDCIESDHAPVTVTEKQDLKTASFGSASFETAFRAGVTHLVKHGKISIFRLIELMSVRPYEILFNKPFEEKDLISMGMVRIDISSNTYFSKRNSFVSNRASIFDGALLHGNASRII
jgi:dihydroorotase